MNPKKNILVVDDNQINLQVVSNYLDTNDYNLFFSLTGRKALEIIQDNEIDLILMDIMMPEMDGFETSRLIQEDEKSKNIPIIFLTAKNQTKDIIQGFKSGGVDYITKPFYGEELIVRVKNHIDLADAKKTILKFQQTRDRLYSVLAHDVSSPLASIILLIDGIKGKYIDSSSPHFDQLISEIANNTKQTLNLIHNILDWTKVQSSSIILNPTMLNVKAIVVESLNILNLNIHEKEIQIKFDINPEMAFLGDEMTCSNIFRNIISNAIKFTPNNGVVSISAQELDSQIMISIEDSGIGMCSETLEKIFLKDEHFTSKGTNNEKGTGLGLYMVKDFIKLNNGTIEVESDLQKGSKFKLFLPKFQGSTLD